MELWTNYLNQEGIPHRDGILGKKNRTLLWRETHLSTLIGFHTHLWETHEPVVTFKSHFAAITLAHEEEMRYFPKDFHSIIAKLRKRSLATYQPKPKIWLTNKQIQKLHKAVLNLRQEERPLLCTEAEIAAFELAWNMIWDTFLRPKSFLQSTLDDEIRFSPEKSLRWSHRMGHLQEVTIKVRERCSTRANWKNKFSEGVTVMKWTDSETRRCNLIGTYNAIQNYLLIHENNARGPIKRAKATPLLLSTFASRLARLSTQVIGFRVTPCILRRSNFDQSGKRMPAETLAMMARHTSTRTQSVHYLQALTAKERQKAAASRPIPFQREKSSSRPDSSRFQPQVQFSESRPPARSQG